MAQIDFECDSFRVTGPRQSDGTVKVTFLLGEYQAYKAAAVLLLPKDKVLKVSVTFDDQ